MIRKKTTTKLLVISVILLSILFVVGGGLIFVTQEIGTTSNIFFGLGKQIIIPEHILLCENKYLKSPPPPAAPPALYCRI